MFWNFLLICAVIGAVGVFIRKLWDKSEPLLAWVLSFFIPGIFIGLILFGFMGLGWFFGWWGDISILGIHPFWVGLVPVTVREIILAFYNWVRR